MGIISLIVLAIGLSMDAFAVAICKGLGMEKVTFKKWYFGHHHKDIHIKPFVGVFESVLRLGE